MDRSKNLVEKKLAKASQKNLLVDAKIEAIDKVIEQIGDTIFQVLEIGTPGIKSSSKKEL